MKSKKRETVSVKRHYNIWEQKCVGDKDDCDDYDNGSDDRDHYITVQYRSKFSYNALKPSSNYMYHLL
jgi:hypothetical protein